MSTKTIRQKQWHFADARLELRAEQDLPAGIAGRLSGVALTYDVVDSYNTVFARNCAKRSIDGRVAARKVPLLMDHKRTVGAHVGVVAMMADVGDSLVMTADIFDTEDGRSALEYVKAVIASVASTGFSIGFIPRRSEPVSIDGKMGERFLEIEIREVSLTPMPAVPGADVTGARKDDADAPVVRSDVDLLVIAATSALANLPPELREAVIAPYRPNTSTPTQETASAPVADTSDRSEESPRRVATMTDRLQAVRASFL